jgi:hypothetical protein
VRLSSGGGSCGIGALHKKTGVWQKPIEGTGIDSCLHRAEVWLAEQAR